MIYSQFDLASDDGTVNATKNVDDVDEEDEDF